MKRLINAAAWLVGGYLLVSVVVTFALDPKKAGQEFGYLPIPLDECGQAYFDEDYDLAATVCAALAEQNQGHALYILSELHEDGLGGLAQDSQLRFELLERAVEAKNTAAMIVFAIAMEAGTRHDQDAQRAFSIMREAAELGDPFAQFWLASLFYSLGKGTDRDEVQAQKWFIIAAENPSFIGDRERFQKIRLEQESELTPEQLVEAEKLADEWRSKNISGFNRLMMWLANQGFF